MPVTLNARPMPQRPANGLLAWEATIGYLRQQYRLDATLTLQAVSSEGVLTWSAYAVWGQITEQVIGKATMPAALRDLWAQIDRNHVIFDTREAMLRRPANYGDEEWLDAATKSVFNQLLDLLRIACDPAWTLTVIYEPVEMADLRFHVQLTGQDNVTMMGQGSTLQTACRDLLRVLAQLHIQRRKRQTSEMKSSDMPE